jgi:hypothetical protein
LHWGDWRRNGDSDSHGNRDSVCNFDGNLNRNAYGYCDSDCHAYCDGNLDSDCDFDRDGNGY